MRTTAGKLSQAQLLIACTDLDELFLNTDGETTYATVTVDLHRETYRIGNEGLFHKAKAQDHPCDATRQVPELGALLKLRFGTF